jgi:hypothetical protein
MSPEATPNTDQEGPIGPLPDALSLPLGPHSDLALRFRAFPAGANIGAGSISLTCVAIGFAVASTNWVIIHSASQRTLRADPLGVSRIALIHWRLAEVLAGDAL